MAHNNYNIVLIRHATSTFNEATYRQSSNLNISHYTWEQMITHDQFNNLVSYHQLYIDAPLCQMGISQCKLSKKECSDIQPNLILVSPYRRSLETCKLLFSDLQNTKIIVQPLIAQVFRYSCDVPVQCQQNKKKYPNFDFTKIQHLGNDWYQSNLSQQIKEKIKSTIKQKNISHYKDKQLLLLQMLKNKQIHENPTMLRKRSSRIKQLLGIYQKQYPIIVLVSHYYIIENLMTKQFGSNDVAQDVFPLNCHPYYHQLSQLQKVS